jgi:hypothetical protein
MLSTLMDARGPGWVLVVSGGWGRMGIIVRRMAHLILITCWMMVVHASLLLAPP